MLRKTLALLLTVSLTAPGCASTVKTHLAPSPFDPARARDEMAEYVRRLPVGSRVRVERTQGGTIKGTLLSAGTDRVVVQRATRIPEPPIEVMLDTVTRIEPEQRSNVTKIVLFGAAAGAAATIGFLFFLATALGD